MDLLKDKHVTLYVTGSVAAYKSALLTRLLIKAGAQVQVVLTRAAATFVTPLTFQTLTQRAVLTDLFSATDADPIKHIAIADWTDIAVVAPATADILAKMAAGLADDAATSTLLATTAPKFVAPAMNTHMLHNPATQRNLATLLADGINVIDPDTGFLAEGYSGDGRMAEPAAILAQLFAHAHATAAAPLSGKHVLITAGGTHEQIDPVRFIGNNSSGKMGYALAAAAYNLGATVTLISTVTRPIPTGVTVIPTTSAAQLQAAVNDNFANSDITIMAAAVADFRPATVAEQKIKKTPDTDGLHLDLVRTPDILATLGANKRAEQLLVGFAAETTDLLVNAQAKLQGKNADMLIANDVSDHSIGFGSDDNRVTILTQNAAPRELATASKNAIAREIMELASAELTLRTN